VSEEPGINVVGAANIMDIETISAVRLVDALERDGLLERRPHPTDRRARSLWLTDRGRAVVGQVQTINAVVHTEAFAGLSGTQQRRLLNLLLTVRTNLGKGAETANPAAA
jgi:MarR family transcriptional regulator, transcriptional regulator for hemolysin